MKAKAFLKLNKTFMPQVNSNTKELYWSIIKLYNDKY